MDIAAPLLASYGSITVLAAVAVLFLAGFTKGAVGFALPMITISGVGSLMSAELALVALMLPSLVTNVWQAFRNGFDAARATLGRFWRLYLTLALMILLCAQLITVIPERALFVILGLMVTSFALVQIVGWRPVIPDRIARPVQWGVGLVSGFFGGLSGVWGPPVTLYLIGRRVEKTAMVRAMGLAFLIGSLALIPAHVHSGVLNAQSWPFSAAMVLPALAGMWLGYQVQDRMDQARFLRVTLIVLVVAGLNLLRRGVF